MAAKATAIAKTPRRARTTKARADKSASATQDAASEGSRSAVSDRIAPAPAATGSQSEGRRYAYSSSIAAANLSRKACRSATKRAPKPVVASRSSCA